MKLGPFELSDGMARLATESAFEVLARAKELERQGHEVINLGIGQPDFQTSGHIVEAAKKALDDGHHGYTPGNGILPLREAVAADIAVNRGATVDPDNIVIVPGGKVTMWYAILMFGGPGTEIMYPNPGFPIYESVIAFSGAKPVPIPLLEKNAFAFDADEVLAQITRATRLIIVNSPANPTGGVVPRAEFDKLAAGLERHPHVTILSDEIYSRLTYDDAEFVTMLDYQHLRDRRVATDFAALLRHRLGHVARDRAHPAFDDVVAVPARSAKLEKDFGPGAARRMGIGDILHVEHHRAHAFVLEIVGREIDERAGQKALQDGLIAACLGAFPNVRERRRIGQHVGLHQPRRPGPELHPIGEARRIAAIQPRDRCDRALHVVVQERVRTVFVGEEHRRVDQVHRQAAPVQPHIGAHLLFQLPHHIGTGRHAIAIEQLFGGAGTADKGPALTEQHLPPGAREVEGGDQPVMTCADDDRIVMNVCHDETLLGIQVKRGSKVADKVTLRRDAAIAAVPSVAGRNTGDAAPLILQS